MCKSVASAYLFALTGAALTAQTQWVQPSLHAGAQGPVTYDGARQEVVQVVPGAPTATWGWSASGWRRAGTASGLVSTSETVAISYAGNGTTVLFCPDPLSATAGQTWLWSGQSWQRATPAASPSQRRGTAMCFDPLRQRVVLFGGANNLGDTWEWDGANWTQVMTGSAAPPARSYHAMVMDILRNELVLFGGISAAPGQLLGDTWIYRNGAWSQAAPSQAPGPRWQHAMAYDVANVRTVLYGGNSGIALDDQWAWDGANWQQVASPNSPGPRDRASMTYDLATGRTLLFGGRDLQRARDDVWAWDGVDWRLAAAPDAPGPGTLLLAEEPGGVLAIAEGGTSQWFWNGAQWTQQAGVSPPPLGQSARLVRDSLRQRSVLVSTGVASPTQTHEWDGTVWRTTQTTQAPGPRHSSSLAFDARRGRVVLFGGLVTFAAGLTVNDTWEYDGVTWQERTPPSAPPARFNGGMAFDAARAEVVLFGGFALGVGSLNDTWVYDGANWLQRAPAISPPTTGTSSLNVLAADPARERLVLLRCPPAQALDVWEWDGAGWRSRPPASPIPAQFPAAAAYDAARGQLLVLLNVATGAVELAMTYGPTFLARAEPFGSNCAGSQGPVALSLRGDARPWLGSAITAEVQPAPTPGVALLWYSGSRSSWGGVPLPIALGPIGMPGCTLDVGLDATLLQQPVAGTASFALQVPNVPSLLGGEVFLQAAVADVGANPAGIAMSHGLALRLGGR